MHRCNPTGEVAKHMSHSTVEKQRRDRINSLIDEVGMPARWSGTSIAMQLIRITQLDL